LDLLALVAAQGYQYDRDEDGDERKVPHDPGWARFHEGAAAQAEEC
jgi:hypothetical protein